jgi:hypothetical protein
VVVTLLIVVFVEFRRLWADFRRLRYRRRRPLVIGLEVIFFPESLLSLKALLFQELLMRCKVVLILDLLQYR